MFPPFSDAQNCSNDTCPKNHFEYYHDNNGYHVDFKMVHYKNDSTKGQATLPLAPKLLEKLVLLEKGRRAVFPKSPTLFHKFDGSPFAAPYFSIYCAKLLCFKGRTFHAIAMRHIFATSLRDFSNSPKSKLLQRAIDELEVDCATMMGNKPPSWDAAYDDGSTLSRKISLAISHWADFEAFVKASHELIKSRVPFDPLKIDMSEITAA